IAGLPPLGGFVGKAMLLASTLPGEGAPGASTAWLWAVVLGGSLMSIVALSRAGSTLFWKAEPAPTGPPAPGPSPRDVLPASIALAGVVAIAVFAAPVQRYAQAAARDLLDPSTLVDQVLRTAPKAGPHQPRPESLR
ncbi:MAG TPA: monovalent cation/H+ antiporter subunit D, partial [Burkholderiaceae bacterium]|nr:monovalent cation/H+ antiporter subunit D [Burkholderiaceae bacterium]